MAWGSTETSSWLPAREDAVETDRRIFNHLFPVTCNKMTGFKRVQKL